MENCRMIDSNLKENKGTDGGYIYIYMLLLLLLLLYCNE